MITHTLPWMAPLSAAAVLTPGESCWVLLYSGQRLEHTGRYSYLALYPQETASGNDFDALTLRSDVEALQHAWFGHLNYELVHSLETLPRQNREYIHLPGLWFARFGLILRFDHDEHILTCFREPHIALPSLLPTAPPATSLPQVKLLTSPMTRETYLTHVADTRDAIIRGEFYQANITRKFTGEFAEAPSPLSLFQALCEASPAAYSASIMHDDVSILTSSPERFLLVDENGHMESRPIKGTAPRFAGTEQDKLSREALGTSEKDRAENLMIVDLMRNDLARSAEPGSIRVERLFEVSSYATLHHMASTIAAQKHAGISTLDAVKLCFPPGSMTGAPKVRAMEWCLQHENIRRGVYSGALGWFGGDGSCDLSVVIRTLVLEGGRFEFQVGGGIVADSDPESEWRETMTKARGICKALGMDMEVLERI